MADDHNNDYLHGVDLSEFERLRVLVRYEYGDDAVRTADLADALRECHNNRQEAYQLLKARHRDAVANAHNDSQASTVTTLTSEPESTRPLEDSPSNGSPNNHKRPSAGTGKDVLDTPSKRMRSLGLHSDTEDAEDVEMAQQSIARTVQDRLLGQAVYDDQWVHSALQALGVRATADIKLEVVQVVEALVAALHRVPEMDLPSVQRDGVSRIVKVLQHLPPQEVRNVNLSCTPTEDELNEALNRASEEFVRATTHPGVMHERSKAAYDAVLVISEACALLMKRLEWFGQEYTEIEKHKRKIEANLQAVREEVSRDLERAMQHVQQSEHSFKNIRSTRLKIAGNVQMIVDSRRTELISQGEEPICASLAAHEEVFCSSESAVRKHLNARTENNRMVEASKTEVVRANTILIVQQKLRSLLGNVIGVRDQSLQNCTVHFDQARKTSRDNVSCALKENIPKLTKLLQMYYDFHTARQKMAQDEQQSQEEALHRHVELFGDMVLSQKEDIEKRMQEFGQAYQKSTQQIHDAAAAQSELWRGRRELLPPDVFDLMISEYGALWQRLGGEAKAMMHDCVDEIQGDQSMSFPTVTRIKMEPQSFFQENSATHSPSTQGAFSRSSARNFIDLTDDGSSVAALRVQPATFSSHSTATEPNPEPNVGDQRRVTHEFPVGTVLFSKMTMGNGNTRIFRGHVQRQLDGGAYEMKFDDGDVYTIPRQYLLTEEQAAGAMPATTSTESDKSSDGCVVM